MRRLAAVIVPVLALLALLALFAADRQGGGAPSAALAAHPELGGASNGSTWYCAAGAAATVEPLAHHVIVTNPERQVLHARVTGYPTVPGAVPAMVEVPAFSQRDIAASDLGAAVMGVVVELLDGRGAVSHRLLGANYDDTGRCTDAAASKWYFPSATTELGSAATLWLLNPFPTDASVDVSVSTDDGVRVPPALDGLVIPGGTIRRIELSDTVQRRAQFAFSVSTRGGQVVAELAQASDMDGGVRGLRLELGVASPATSWVISDGFGGAASNERIVVFNTVDDPVHVSVAVHPAGLDASDLPEPFELDIQPHRFAQVVLNDETRLADDGLRWFHIDATDAVAVERVISLRGDGGDTTVATRPKVRSGLANSTGSAVAARQWLLDGLSPGSEGQSLALVTNPSPDSIAVVELFAIHAGTRSPIGERVEVPASSTLAVDLGPTLANDPGAVLVRAASGVVVEGRTTSGTHHDLSVLRGVPFADGLSALPDDTVSSSTPAPSTTEAKDGP